MNIEKTGYNINQLIDTKKIGNDFVNYFYSKWIINPYELITDNIVKNCTNFLYKSTKYDYQNFITFMYDSKSLLKNIEIQNIEILQSGSRRLDICVSGNFHFNDHPQKFCQYFLLVSEPKNTKNWFIQNTILNEI